MIDLEDHLPGMLEGRVVTNGERIPLNVMGRKIDFVINNTIPTSDINSAVSLDTRTKYVMASVPKGAAKGIPKINHEDIG